MAKKSSSADSKKKKSSGLLKFLEPEKKTTVKSEAKPEKEIQEDVKEVSLDEQISQFFKDKQEADEDSASQNPKFEKGTLKFEEEPTTDKKPTTADTGDNAEPRETTIKFQDDLSNFSFKEWQIDNTPFGEAVFQNKLPYGTKERGRSAYIYLLELNNLLVNDLEEGILLSSEYDPRTNKVVLQFYNTKTKNIVYYMDNTNYEPYCYHKKPESEILGLVKDYEGFSRIETVKKFDNLMDCEIEVSKIIVKTPNDVGGKSGVKNLLDGAWEADVRYHHNYLFDRQLIIGLPYSIANGIIQPKELTVAEDLTKKLKEFFKDEAPPIQEMAERYQKVFAYSVEDFKRLAIDIEVEYAPGMGLPDPKVAAQAIISTSFVGSDGMKKVFFLDRPEIPLGIDKNEWPEKTEVFRFKDEKELLKETFRIIWSYPMVITFNGDNFDLPYLFYRADKLKIPRELNPISVTRGYGFMIKTNAEIKHGFHLDLYQVFSNRSLKGYAFGGDWLRNGLEEISMHMLGEGKVKHTDIPIDRMHICDLVYYNLYDSILTLDLTRVNDNLVLNLLIILARITKLPLNDLFRSQISLWIRSLLYYEHRFRNILIPNRKEIRASTLDADDYLDDGDSDEVDYDGINFQGAYVIQPTPGIHFDVDVLDFSSLYPSIIKTKNLSYETVNCIHDECKTNLIPGTNYYACTKRMGIFAYVVGFLRDIRVKWFKPISSDKSIPKNDRAYAKVIQSALKVFINGSYGVFGAPIFPLFCLPVAESTTAVGRFSIQSTIEKATSMGISVLYGDSDSIFLLHPTEKQIEELIEWSAKTLDLDLDKDKSYKFLALSDRKKNYLGIHKGSNYIEIKGMLARKHNTPQFIKTIFNEAMELIAHIDSMDAFKKIKKDLIAIIRRGYLNIGKPEDKGGFPIEEYTISVVLSKPLESYTKTIPQHVTAAKMLPIAEQKALGIGSIINYVKTKNKEGVKPVKFASISDIDVAKYREFLESAFEQILDAFNMDFEEIKGTKKLSDFFS